MHGKCPAAHCDQSTVHAQVSLPRSCSACPSIRSLLLRLLPSPYHCNRCPFNACSMQNLGVPSNVHAQVSLPRSCTGVPSSFIGTGCPLRLLTVHAQVSLPHSCASNPPPFVLSLSKHERWSAHMPRYANATLPPSETFANTPSPLTGEGRDGGEEWLDDEQPRTTHAPLVSGESRKDGVTPGPPSGIQGGLRTR